MRRGKLHLPAVSTSLLLAALSFSCPWLAVSQSVVKYLPGFSGPLPFYLETGYIGVAALDEHQLFYYFVESENNPKDDPLVLWLTGGPGCTGWSGLVYEIGPLHFPKVRYNGSLPTLLLRQHSWTKVASIIFIDSPVGTGFSYSSGSKRFINGDIKSSREVYQFLRKWMMDHPQFLSNPLYIGGDSYSGLTLPIVVQEIANGIDAGHEPILNLKGYFLGNPRTTSQSWADEGSWIPYCHGMGLLSDELFESTKKHCQGDYSKGDYASPECKKDIEEARKCVARIGRPHISEPECPRVNIKSPFLEPDCPRVELKPPYTEVERRFLEGNSIDPPFKCRAYVYLLSFYWIYDARVQKALHVREGTGREWRRCNTNICYAFEVNTTVNYHLNLTSRGYRSLIYSGDHDLLVPFVGTQAWIKSLNFSIIDDWRPWFVDTQVAGYTRTYSNNLTFATVKGAGHTAPEFRPKECFEMIKRWISHKPL